MKSLKNMFLICTLLFSVVNSYGQNLSNSDNAPAAFKDQGSFAKHFQNKIFYNSQTGWTINYGYISSHNTYGITVKNSNQEKIYAINCDVDLYSTFAVVTGTLLSNSRSIKVKFYENKAKIDDQTFYLK